MTSRFAIVEIHCGFYNEKPALPWRILECYPCFDGCRIRICMDAYATKEEARWRLQEYWNAKASLAEADATAKFMASVTGDNHDS